MAVVEYRIFVETREDENEIIAKLEIGDFAEVGE